MRLPLCSFHQKHLTALHIQELLYAMEGLTVAVVMSCSPELGVDSRVMHLSFKLLHLHSGQLIDLELSL